GVALSSAALADHLLERLELLDRLAPSRRIEARVRRAEVEERDRLAGLVARTAGLPRGLVLGHRLRHLALSPLDVAEEAVHGKERLFTFAREGQPLLEDLLGLIEEVETDVELRERSVEPELIGLGRDRLRVGGERAGFVVEVQKHLGELEVRVRDVRIELDGLLEWALCIRPARRPGLRLTREREAVEEEVVREVRRELLRLRARARDLVPLLFSLVRRCELPEDPVI